MRHLNSFFQTDIYKKIVYRYDYIYHDVEKEVSKDWFTQTRVQQHYRITDIAPWYYVWQVMEKANNKPVLDFGCGAHIFKNYWPNIIGIDSKDFSDSSFFPLPDKVTDGLIGDIDNGSFSENLYGIIAICSLHFGSVDSIIGKMNSLQTRLATGCRMYVAINTERTRENSNSSKTYQETFDMISTYCSHNKLNILESDVKPPMGYRGEEGNVKMLLEKV